VRICDLRRSVLYYDSNTELDHRSNQLSVDAHYSAPECFNGEPTLKSDVFSFGLILYELLTGQPVFSPHLEHPTVMRMILSDRARPDIPDSITPEVKLLIEDCLKYKPYKRPSFETILSRLDKIGFQITDGVNSRKVRQFVTAVNNREKELGIEV
jgi:serine/threonine protein kinase